LGGLYERALEEARKAISLDKAGRLEEAVEHYLRAALLFTKLGETTTEPRLRKIYVEKAEAYIMRYKQIKEHPKALKAPETVSVPEEAIKGLPPELAGAVLVERPDITWDDIGGLYEAKRLLMEAVVWPLMRPELFKGPREPWKGILLFGPPGCGKTLLAKAVAGQCKATFFNVSAATIMSKWLGESEKNVRLLFETARKTAPSVIFIDEVDSLLSVRAADEIGGERRVKTQFLVELDGLRSRPGGNVVVIGATNRPWDIDPAMIRRFERRIFIPLPDREAREEIFKIHLKEVELGPDVDIAELAELTVGYTGSDIRLVCREAAMEPIRELMGEGLLESDVKPRPISKADFVKALKKIKPVVKPHDIRRYLEWAKRYGEV